MALLREVMMPQEEMPSGLLVERSCMKLRAQLKPCSSPQKKMAPGLQEQKTKAIETGLKSFLRPDLIPQLPSTHRLL
jgi:hypothetical protein